MGNIYKTYRYFWVDGAKNPREGVICASVEVDRDTGEGRVGFSFYSPSEKDAPGWKRKHFTRKEARIIADGRKENNRTSVSFQLTAGGKLSKKLNSAVWDEAIENYFDKTKNKPRWAYKHIRNHRRLLAYFAE